MEESKNDFKLSFIFKELVLQFLCFFCLSQCTYFLFQKQNMTSFLIRSSFCLYHMSFPGFLKVNPPTCLMGEFYLDIFLYIMQFILVSTFIVLLLLLTYYCTAMFMYIIAFMIALWLLACIYYRLSFYCLQYILHFWCSKDNFCQLFIFYPLKLSLKKE